MRLSVDEREREREREREKRERCREKLGEERKRRETEEPRVEDALINDPSKNTLTILTHHK